MIKQSEEQLIDYIRDFKNKDGQSPCNEQQFINPFLTWITNADLEFTFDGDGAYFGKQITLTRLNHYGYDILNFEIAYDQHNIVIYNGNNEGYWVPPYVTYKSEFEDFHKMQEIIYNLIRKNVGIPVL